MSEMTGVGSLGGESPVDWLDSDNRPVDPRTRKQGTLSPVDFVTATLDALDARSETRDVDPVGAERQTAASPVNFVAHTPGRTSVQLNVSSQRSQNPGASEQGSGRHSQVPTTQDTQRNQVFEDLMRKMDAKMDALTMVVQDMGKKVDVRMGRLEAKVGRLQREQDQQRKKLDDHEAIYVRLVSKNIPAAPRYGFCSSATQL